MGDEKYYLKPDMAAYIGYSLNNIQEKKFPRGKLWFYVVIATKIQLENLDGSNQIGRKKDI